MFPWKYLPESHFFLIYCQFNKNLNKLKKNTPWILTKCHLDTFTKKICIFGDQTLRRLSDNVIVLCLCISNDKTHKFQLNNAPCLSLN